MNTDSERSLAAKLRRFIEDPNAMEEVFTGEEALNADDSFTFRQTVKVMSDDGKLIATRDVEGNFTLRKTSFVQGAAFSAPSLEASDVASAAVQKTPNRVTLDSVKEKISQIEYIHPKSIPHMTIAVVILQNGFALTGKSAPADAENFDAELGRQFAYEDALRQMWPLEAYLLRERLSRG